MRARPHLRQLIRQITVASLAGAPVAVALGCAGGMASNLDVRTPDGSADGGSTDGSVVRSDGGIDLAGFESTVCTGNTYEELTGLVPAQPVDYVELRTVFAGSDTVARSTKNGTPCATATNAATCNAALAAKQSSQGWSMPSNGNAPASRTYLVYTRGDTVGLVETLDQLSDFLEPIATTKDAALLVHQRGYRFVCPSQNAKTTATGVELVARSGFACGAGSHEDEHRIAVATDGTITVLQTVIIKEGDPYCAVGRRPEGLAADDRAPATDPLARFFADVARLEAASVPAFEQLARDLAFHRAPAELVSAALDAREDEVRHARAMRDVAQRCGAETVPPVVTIGAPRPLFDLAIENAVEGCVRETYGALVASLQAERSEDEAIARTLRTIADDETNHAVLSWEIASWVDRLLDASQRRAVATARADALRELRASLETDPADTVQRIGGMPDRRTALGAFDALFGDLAGLSG